MLVVRTEMYTALGLMGGELRSEPHMSLALCPGARSKEGETRRNI